MTRTDFISHLHDLDACNTALAWIDQTPGEPADLWTACQRGDWMIWLLAEVAYDARTMRHIACDFAEDVLPIYEREYPADHRPRNCIAVARRYADGEATDDELIAARDAANGAAWAAWAAASDAAYAAWAASRAANSTAASDAASDAEWVAARAASSAAAWDVVWARQADMVRARVTWADVERAMTEFMARKGKE